MEEGRRARTDQVGCERRAWMSVWDWDMVDEVGRVCRIWEVKGLEVDIEGRGWNRLCALCVRMREAGIVKNVDDAFEIWIYVEALGRFAEFGGCNELKCLRVTLYLQCRNRFV